MYYESCMDPDEIIEKLGAKPMLTMLKDIGGWNNTTVNFTKWSLQKVLQKLHNSYNMGGLFGWAVGEDDRNSTKHIIQIDQGGLGLKIFFKKLKYLMNYQHYLRIANERKLFEQDNTASKNFEGLSGVYDCCRNAVGSVNYLYNICY